MFDKFVNNMNPIQYQILRYLPDRVSGEFVNLGVATYDQASRTLRSEFVVKTERISCLFPGLDCTYLENAVGAIKKHLDELSCPEQTANELAHYLSIENFTQTALPVDDSSLFFSEIKCTLDVSVDTAAFDLFERFTRASFRND